MSVKGLLHTLPVISSDLRKGWPWAEETPPNMYDRATPWPKITIITPSYNQGQFLEETIRSVLLQNYPNLEYIVIDGRSSDESVDIIKKYGQWIDYWVSEKDRGQSHAINKGLVRATGDIIQWINSDDVLRPQTLFEVAQVLLHHPKKNCLIGPTWAFGIADRILAPTPIFPQLRQTVSAARINQPGTFFRAEAFRAITPVHEELHYMMDLHIWLRYLLIYGTEKIAFTDQLLVNFREHANSKTVSSESLFFKDRFWLLGCLQDYLMKSTDPRQLFGNILVTQNVKNEFLYGINDCLMYWWKFFSKKSNRPMIRVVKPLVNIQYLGVKELIVFFILYLSYLFLT